MNNMNYIVIRKEKLQWGKVDLRSYEVQKAITSGMGIRVLYKDEYMDLSPEDLQLGGHKYIGKVYDSKYVKGMKYYLIGYTWNPTIEEPDEVQLSLL